MECKNCHSKWETSKSVSKTYTECPFCGANLVDAEEEPGAFFDNSKEALVFIKRKHGADVLLGSELKNFLLDYVPRIAALRKNVIFSVSSSGAADILKSNLNAGANEQEMAFRQAVSRVIDTYGTERGLVEDIMLEFVGALGWKMPVVMSSASVLKTQNSNVAGDFVAAVLEKSRIQVEQLRKSAEQGNADAQNSLGNMYRDGRGVEKDEAEAVKWYRKSAEQGNADAQCNLGSMYRDGRGVEKDETEVVKWYRTVAERGNESAHWKRGINGYDLGVERNYAEAVKWYRKSAEQGSERGQWELGNMYRQGHGVEKNEVEAMKWYRKSAEQGNMKIQYTLGTILDSYEQLYPLHGDYWRFYRGKDSYAKDVEAAKWYRKSAEQGFMYAQYNLALMYSDGRGVKKDDVEAVKWYRKAAEQGDAYAQHKLGTMYSNGRGVEKDEAEAAKWYREALKGGVFDSDRMHRTISCI